MITRTMTEPTGTTAAPYGNEMILGSTSSSLKANPNNSELSGPTERLTMDESWSTSPPAELRAFDAEIRKIVTDGDAFERLVMWLAVDSQAQDDDFGRADGELNVELSTYHSEWRVALRSAARSQGTTAVRQMVESAGGDDYRTHLNFNRAKFGFPPVDGIETLDGAALALDPLLGEIFSKLPPMSDSTVDTYAAQAGAVILQVAQTTILAISVLLRNGYVLDATARWRGFHELACAANLIAASPDPEDCARRYLIHGGFLSSVDHSAVREKAVTRSESEAEWLTINHGWLCVDFPSQRKSHFSQKWIFDKLGTVSKAFQERWINESHSMVHMSSAAVSQGSQQAGGAPAGWSPIACDEYSVATLYSLSSLIASILELSLISPETRDPESASAWYRELRIRIDQSLATILADKGEHRSNLGSTAFSG